MTSTVPQAKGATDLSGPPESLGRNAEHCMVCGAALEYLNEAHDLGCSYCGGREPGHIRCPNGHYVCDACHNRDAMRIITDIALATTSGDPFEIADLMMSYPGLPMLGCQHAYIAGGAFMSAIRNEGSRSVTNRDIKEVFQRTQKQAHGGYCGLSGVCGIVPAIGSCFALLAGSACGTDREQRSAMEAVTRITRAITDLTGPSCCKAYVWTSLETSVDYLRESLGIILPSTHSIACTYGPRHPHGCREAKCPYFPASELPCRTVVTADEMADIVMDQNKGGMALDIKMDALLTRSIELGAEKSKVIDTGSIVVEEWVRWKCLYGCAFHGKDAYHPPCAPDAGSTMKMMKEYSKAILMTGDKGKALTETAVRLEGEAYNMGFYKAFAMTALSSGPEGST